MNTDDLRARLERAAMDCDEGATIRNAGLFREAAAALAAPVEPAMPVIAAALATTLKEECERQHARAEQAEQERDQLRAQLRVCVLSGWKADV